MAHIEAVDGVETGNTVAPNRPIVAAQQGGGLVDELLAIDEAAMYERPATTRATIERAATALAEKAARIVELEVERNEARGIVRDIYWMAVRYADGRKSYAVGMCNDALRKAYGAGWLVYKDDKHHDLDPQYARDGMFDVEWRSALDAEASRAEAAETALTASRAECEGLRAALRPFAEAWDVAVHHEDLVRHLTLGQLGELAAHEVSGAHFRNARAALSQKETGA